MFHIPVANRSNTYLTEEGMTLVFDAAAKKEAEAEDAGDVATWLEYLPALMKSSGRAWGNLYSNARNLGNNTGVMMRAHDELDRTVRNAGKKTKDELSPIEKSEMSLAAYNLFDALTVNWKIAVVCARSVETVTKSADKMLKGRGGIDGKFLTKYKPDSMMRTYNSTLSAVNQILADRLFFAEYGTDQHMKCYEAVSRTMSGKDGGMSLHNAILESMATLGPENINKLIGSVEDSVMLTTADGKKAVKGISEMLEELLRLFHDYAVVCETAVNEAFFDVYLGKDSK